MQIILEGEPDDLVDLVEGEPVTRPTNATLSAFVSRLINTNRPLAWRALKDCRVAVLRSTDLNAFSCSHERHHRSCFTRRPGQ